MFRDDSSPNYEQLFGDLDFREEDDARSVYSPAAYFVDLLELLEGTFQKPSLLDRRPDLKKVVLDARNTFTQTPYLDIVNEVLERLAGADPYEALRTGRKPFSLKAERLKKYLAHLQVTPEELYRLFAARVDHDIVAREYLGLSAEDVTLVTTVLSGEVAIARAYGVAATAALADVDTFARATGLTGDQVRELAGVTVGADGHVLQGLTLPWLERTNRVVHLARLSGLTITELNLVLRTCCADRLDLAALRAVAVVSHVGRAHDLPVTEVCGLVAAALPTGVEIGSGDILAARNRDYRHRLASAIDVQESDIVETVTRYRARYAAQEQSPFDQGGVGLPQIGLLQRVGRLTSALGLSTGELFDVLVALESDPSLHRYSTFTLLDATPPGTRNCFKLLEEGSLWLAQTLFAVVAWMQAGGFAGQELVDILGGGPAEENLEEINALNQALQQVAFSPALFESARFGARAAQVVHDVLTAYEDTVVSARDNRLLRLDPAQARAAAYDAVTDLGVVAAEDFLGLGLGERLTAKIFSNLVHQGHLRPDGTLIAVGTTLAGDFTPYAELLFKSIGAVVNGSASFFPSDLAAVNNMTQAQQAELYDNLVHNGYLTEDGDLTDPDFFLDAGNLDRFAVNVDLSDVHQDVLDVLTERVRTFAEGPLAPEIDEEKLLESLRFNGYIDQNNNYVDKSSLIQLGLDNFGLALEFHPRRKSILAAIQAQIAEYRRGLFTFTPDDFTAVADEAMGRRVAEGRDTDFTETERALVDDQLAVVKADEEPYTVSRDAVLDLGFDEEEADQLLAVLVDRGHLTDGRAVPWDRLDYFLNVNNALGFVLKDLEDFSTDVFFLVHTVAQELSAAVDEVVARLTERAAAQRDMLFGSLADTFGVPSATAAAICEAVTDRPMEVLAAPVLTAGEDLAAVPADPHFRLLYRRVRRFALLAGKLGLDPTEIAVVFRDQDLVGKFPEHLALPAGLKRFDAVLESFDGNVYLFGEGGYWTYPRATYTLLSAAPKPLTELSPRFADLVAIDAAFTYTDSTEWLVGHGADGVARCFTREPGGTRWAPRAQTWGKVRNTFDDPVRIDSAYVDKDGRTYLFSGDQYVRYSTGDYSAVDEGFPRSTSEWWGSAVKGQVDASFQAPDGRIHLFSGTTWQCGDTTAPIAGKWGRVRSSFSPAERIDAAYTDGTAAALFAGNQVIRYSDCLENPGVLADEGHPRLIHDVPAEFEGAVDAAFVDAAGVLHLFRNGRTVAMTGARAKVVKTADRWGVLPPALPSGTVDAAFVGLDGRTYLFSGETYLRYSTSDYATVDSGYPRSIAADWGGLTRVDAAFVMDGTAYLFGVGGALFELPAEWESDLNAGRVSPQLRNRFQEHGLSPVGITGKAPEWHVTTDEAIPLTVRREGLRIKVYGEGARFHVRYSTKDYRTPDAGFPKPLSGNWWNLDLGPVDAVFTGTDNRTYLFSGDRYVWFDAIHRWWSEPLTIRDHWDSIPFDRVDAAFAGQDGRTYVFSGNRYIRYSTSDYTAVDDRYPARVDAFWGNVPNNLARTGQVDAALVMDVTEQVDGVDTARTYTYLFSGDQYVRYLGRDYAVVQPGYPRTLAALKTEPGMGALDVALDGVDAALSDRRNTYLFRGDRAHVVSRAPYRSYPGYQGVTCAFLDGGSVVTEGYEGWLRRSSIEERQPSAAPYRPRTLRTVPQEFRTGLDAVLSGADGNTYLFKGALCFNTQLNHAYPLAEEWGRPRNNVYLDSAVDAAFLGRDGRTYLFSGDQFTVEPGGEPQLISDHWAGLTSVDLAYVRGTTTYLFEKPDATGARRYLCYSGMDYTVPDQGYPAVTDATFWQSPNGFPVPEAVLFEGGTMILLGGDRCVSYDEKTGSWSFPRPVERIWRGYPQGVGALRTAFTAQDGTTYFFFGTQFAAYKDGAFGPLTSVRDRWGLSANPFGTTVDAAFAWRGTTFLFSGDHYVRYSTGDYRYVDAGYPKKTSGNLRKEEAFRNFPESFEDVLAGPLDAVIANDRTVYAFAAGTCHVASRDLAGSVPLAALGRIRNTVAERVDAAFVADGKTYLFSGDQYVRYSGSDYTYVDDGYPRSLRDPADFQVPDQYQDGVDAAFKGLDGRMHYFRGKELGWGKVTNAFTGQHLDAAFVAPGGELYAFSGGQFIRYRPGVLDLVEEGFPRTVRDDWGDLPAGFEAGPDGAFVFEGRTYLTKGEQYVRYSGQDYHRVDRAFPQEFQHRWSDIADYRLSDVHVITRFAELARAHPDGLPAFLLTGTEDPYLYLSDLFGWDMEELRWARRHSELLTPETKEEARFEVEFLLKLADLFTASGRIGLAPQALYEGVWSKVYGSGDLEAAATALSALLRTPNPIHDELNVLRRDALVSMLADRGYDGARELYQRLLLDVEMGSAGTTSRVREAIAAAQLFVHRYLLDLEPVTGDSAEVRARLRSWWAWMKNYRIWEANRKVFLYPENYLRPELRPTKTPAFRALENDLLQEEITPDAVQRVYKKYLDEYTEVSRLAIAGGYVYTADDAPEGERRLVLFGRTRTAPRRYYFRDAEFHEGERLSATWNAWQKVDVQIDSDVVDPVHAFGRIFVFWTVVENAPPENLAGTVVTAKKEGESQKVQAPPPAPRVQIFYSFRNLNGEWSSAQLLAADARKDGPISGVSLYVQASRNLPGGPPGTHDSIVVQCTYKVSGKTTVESAFTLTPELYALRAANTVPPPRPTDLTKVFAEPVPPIVRFNMPADSPDGPWFSVDHKGGSFLCRPVSAPYAPYPWVGLPRNPDRLPTNWAKISASFRTADGTMYFFDSAAQKYIQTPPGKDSSAQTKKDTTDRWGLVANNLIRTGVVDAALARGSVVYLFSGKEYYRYTSFPTLDTGYPKLIADNDENLPKWQRVDWVLPLPDGRIHFGWGDQHFRVLSDWTQDRGQWKPPARPADAPTFTSADGVHTFDNKTGTYTVQGDKNPRSTRALGKTQTTIVKTGAVDLAYVNGDKLFLTSGGEFYRYTLPATGPVPDFVDTGYPKPLPRALRSAFRGYVFSGDDYAVLGDQEPDAAFAWIPVQGNWRALPTGGYDSVLEGDALYFFQGTTYATYPLGDLRPYEIAALPNEIIRLTSSTAYQLNRELLTGGVAALLAPSTQETDELPRFSQSRTDATTIRVRPEVWKAGVPTSSHLDFNSSNGIYYWEIFFHAPLLIAQALNGAQRFEDARRWYEYVFDPTRRNDYWRFLPFLAIDIPALVSACRREADGRKIAGYDAILTKVEALAPAFEQVRTLTTAELTFLSDLAGTGLDAVRTALPSSELVEMLGYLRRQYDLLGDRDSLLRAYLDDPFDPHAIADLRPVAYRRAVVMAYIDNIIDWGDMLFRQYTGESIDEARMLYIFAHDLLGERPFDRGPRALTPSSTYEQLDGGASGDVAAITAGGAMLEGTGTVHESIARPYFYVPDNATFHEYWARIEDRLRKIRQSLDIMGIARPVPLFEPPADVMALVRGRASGASLDQLTANPAAALPHYRFAFLFRKAQDLVGQLRQYGGDLLGHLERRDLEQLSLLQNRQEAAILALTTAIKEAQVAMANESVAELQATKKGAEDRIDHFEKLIAQGLTPVQEAQISMMSLAATANFVAMGIKIAAAIALSGPEVYVGPFIVGIREGSQEVGNALNTISDVSSTLGQGFSSIGEILGVRADQDRQELDWRLQLGMARTDLAQMTHQLASAELQVAVAKRELEVHTREKANLDAVNTFLTDKFTGAQLYGWMAGRLSATYFQSYHLAYELARSAERAYQFERGLTETFVQPTYWDSRRGGLLAGETLALDLERLGKAYVEADRRGMEITKKVSLLAVDPLALLALRGTGTCEFALTEALFDRDFPGHYRRQIRTVSVTFQTADGPIGIPATLTQLDNKVVLSPDPKAVKFLLDPKGSPPESLRGDWRPSQQIALSDLEEYKENNGLFELRFDDDRYLPFEGTGAISRWRLSGRPQSALTDVTITVKYTAQQGGEPFATAVKGMLKPYPSARFFDVATEFPEEWAAFQEGAELVLPFTPDLFPGMSGRQVTGLFASYGAAGARFLLNGDQRLALNDGKLLRTPGLNVGGAPWNLVLEGDRSVLTTVGLVVAYRAGVR
ncbi:hemopexin repeat-containing protein [Nonomuraea sp. NPDC050556]|uniref:Tc toxin subunit A-related protein n=1 Tax=Nonomuraea sp. NPDC050556 TaxID=3364369 RepID=UPI0037A1B421